MNEGNYYPCSHRAGDGGVRAVESECLTAIVVGCRAQRGLFFSYQRGKFLYLPRHRRDDQVLVLRDDQDGMHLRHRFFATIR